MPLAEQEEMGCIYSYFQTRVANIFFEMEDSFVERALQSNQRGDHKSDIEEVKSTIETDFVPRRFDIGGKDEFYGSKGKQSHGKWAAHLAASDSELLERLLMLPPGAERDGLVFSSIHVPSSNSSDNDIGQCGTLLGNIFDEPYDNGRIRDMFTVEHPWPLDDDAGIWSKALIWSRTFASIDWDASSDPFPIADSDDEEMREAYTRNQRVFRDWAYVSI